jgi:hypothetical protein
LAAKAHAAVDQYTNDAFVQRALAEMDFDAKAIMPRPMPKPPARWRSTREHDGDDLPRARAGGQGHQGQRSRGRRAWKQARAWFLKANGVEPEHGLPFVMFYDSFIAQGRPIPDGAKQGLLAAGVLAPSDNDVRLRIAAMQVHDGNLAKARALCPDDEQPASGQPFGLHQAGRGDRQRGQQGSADREDEGAARGSPNEFIRPPKAEEPKDGKDAKPKDGKKPA